MLDVVKFTWRNQHGYWIPVSWLIALTEDDEAKLRSRASLGRPSLSDFRVLDRFTIPESLRITGRSSQLLSNVIIYDRKSDEYNGQQMLDAMLVATA